MDTVFSRKPAHSATRLSGLLRCPQCGSTFEGEHRLVCQRGHAYDVINGVPRLLESNWDPNQSDLVVKTRVGFGKQWEQFANDATVTLEDLMKHLPAGWNHSTFSGLILDVGCGMGRYAALVSGMGATVIGLEPSAAVTVAAQRSPEILFVQGDIIAAPFAPKTFDLVYSFGVIHHLPDPRRGLRACFELIRPGGLMLIWVYSKRRGAIRWFRQRARLVIRKFPSLIHPAAWSAAVCLWLLFLLPRRSFHLELRRFSFYDDKSFRQLRVDCYDALQAPLEVYLSDDDCRDWLQDLPSGSSGFEKRRDGSGWIIWARA